MILKNRKQKYNIVVNPSSSITNPHRSNPFSAKGAIFLICALLLLQSCAFFPMNSPNRLQGAEWSYSWSRDADDAAWHTWTNYPAEPPGRGNSRWLTIKTTLPQSLSSDDAIWIGRIFRAYQVFINSEQIGSYAFSNGQPEPLFSGFRWNFYKVPEHGAGAELQILCYSDYFYIGPVYRIIAAPKADIVTALFLAELLPFALCLGLILFGAGLIIQSLLKTRITGAVVLGILSVCVGLYTIRYMNLRFFLMDSPFAWDALGTFITFLFPFLFGILVMQLFFKTPPLILKFNLFISTILLVPATLILGFMVINRILMFAPDQAPKLLIIRFILHIHLLQTVFTVLYLMIRKAYRKDGDAKTILGGFAFLIVFAVPSVLGGIGINLDDFQSLVYVGMSGLIISFGIVVLRRFYRLFLKFQEGMAELRTAELYREKIVDKPTMILDSEFKIVSINQKMIHLLKIEEDQNAQMQSLSREFIRKLRLNSGMPEMTLRCTPMEIFSDPFREDVTVNLTVLFQKKNNRIENIILQEKTEDTLDLEGWNLTAREKEVIQQSFLGKRNRDIAEYLGITERTVKSHITNIYNKFTVSNKMELMHVIKTQKKAV